jgi:WD40 repeat protein
LQPFEGVGHSSYVTGIVRSGKVLVSGSYDGSMCWWDTEQRLQIQTHVAHEKWIRRLAVSPDGKLVASVADGKTKEMTPITINPKIPRPNNKIAGIHKIAYTMILN